MKNRMKIRMMSLVIMLSLCVGLTACQTADVGGDISTENVRNETEIPTEESSQEVTEAPTEESIELSTEPQETESQETKPPTTEALETEEPATEAEEIPVHTEFTQTAGDEVVQPFDLGTTVLVDLDGDGVKEKVLVMIEESVSNWSGMTFYSYYPAVLINEHYFEKEQVNHLYAESPYHDYFYLMDLDVTDQWIEIALREAGPSGDPRTTFFRYHDGQMICIGSVPNVLWIKEDGTMSSTVLGDGRYTGNTFHRVLETAWAVKTWKLVNSTAFEATIEEEIPEYYEFTLYRTKEEWCEVIEELQIYGEKNENSDEIIILPIGTKLEFLRHYPEGDWIEIVFGEEEVHGWMQKSKSLGQCIKGLNCAD